jgi:succinoglycan biosynthesis transport protein ExoP
MNRNLVASSASSAIPAGGFPAGGQNAAGFAMVDTAAVFQKLARRKWFICITTIALFVIAAAVILFLPRWYTAETEIMIDVRPQGVDIAAVLSRLPIDSQAVLTEAEALRSRAIAQKTIVQLGLLQNPEFNANIIPNDMSPRSVLRRAKAVVAAWSQYLPSFGGEKKAASDSTLSDATDIFAKHLQVVPMGRSQVLKATFTSENPELAAAVLNTLASAYIANQIEVRLAVPQKIAQFLQTQLSEMGEKVRRADEAAERYRDQEGLQQGLVQGRDALLLTQEITEANGALIAVRAKRQDAESRLNEIQAKPESFSEVLGNPLVQNLRQQEATLKQNRAELLTSFGSRYPRLLQVEASVHDIEKRIAFEIEKIVRSIRSEVAVQSDREAALELKLVRLKGQLQIANGSRVNLAALVQEAEANRAIFTTALTQYKQLNSQQTLRVADSYVLSRAEEPSEPSFPHTLAFLALGLVGAFAISGSIALLKERDGNAIRSSDDVRPYLRARPLGLVPELTAGARPAGQVIDRPQSAFTESIRNLLCGLLSANDHKVVLITSARPGEGKTTIAVALARLAALSGKNTVLVDCDLRRPAVHEAFGSAAEPGLTEMLQREGSFADVRRRDKASPLTYITSGRGAPHAPSLFLSAGMKQFIQALRSEYDLVILDSPPTGSVADARVLAPLVDEMVLVVSWDETPTKLVRAEIERLQDYNASIVGVILNKVDLFRHAKYACSDSGLYSGSNARYYVN